MTERHRRKTRRELGCGCVLVLLTPFLFIQSVLIFMGIYSAIPHRLPLHQNLDRVVQVELVNEWDWENPKTVTLTPEQEEGFLRELSGLKTYHYLGDPVFEYGNMQIHLTYENGDQDILGDNLCGSVTDGVEDMDISGGLNRDDMLRLFEDYFPELKGKADHMTGVETVWQNIKRTIAAVLIILLLWSIFSAVGIVRYSKLDERYWADTIIVLGAETDGQEPNPVFRERLNHAMTLYNGGYSKHIILTGGLTEGNELADSQIAAKYLTEAGIPADAIFVEVKSTITQENISEAKAIMDAEGFQSALIVSDPLHMKRAMVMADDYGINGFSSPTPTSMYRTWRTKLPFLFRETFFYVGYRIYRIFVHV